eukprot:CAMPEP_0170146156 /NCGR_PEP_ID=MMETSP0033_2-20121228/28581_1 /TAXON_ID=195969 /ORGANISM="Dolichomastix tenuilepis, Strain CCMP3274" /LENGTH=49 /DNA_ID= /DNA_START= /DNA_END= /DNA_ORIENTATION=
MAAHMGHCEMAALLLSCGAVVDQANERGFTALHMAAEKGHCEVADLLLS